MYDADTLAIGVLGKPHGVRGEIVLRPYNTVGRARPLSPADADAVTLVKNGETTRRRLRACRAAGENLLVTFDGVDSLEAARTLTHCEVRVPRLGLPPLAPGEYFVEDVVGCQVENSAGQRLGTVSGTFWNGAHDVMTVAAPAGETLIPMVPDVVLAVDVGARVVRVAWEASDENSDESSDDE